MKTTDLYKTTSAKINESLEKTFGKKLKLETFSNEQLEDARNKLRTQVHQVRSNSAFNENLENEAFLEAQWMLDAINAEILEREESVEDVIESEMKEETTINESEVDEASAIVTAKTMVDKVGRWIEELSGMENDTLLSLGDSIRDQMGSEKAKQFITSTAPAIQDALNHLKDTRDTMATSLRVLTGEESGVDMLGDVGAEDDVDVDTDIEIAAEPDTMNIDIDEPEDEFAAAEPAAGGIEAAGRAKRESIDRGSNLMKILAG